MESLSALLEHQSSRITHAQLRIARSVELREGIRSVWYDIITRCLYLCSETTGEITAIEPDGETALIEQN